MTITCRTCGQGSLSLDLDLGMASFCVQAPTSVEVARNISKHPFRLGMCRDCGVIQLLDLPPLDALRPVDQAILFRDPERHLDDLARITASLLESTSAHVLGMTYKDAPLLDRFASLGLSNLKLLDRDEDWGLHDPRLGIETIQARCTVDWADEMRRKYGRVDLLLVRHVLEHAHNFPEFLAACRRLTDPDGLVLFEVPGCETEMARGDAGALWEEHVSYFTMESLRRSLAAHGYRSLVVGNYPYTIEDCLASVGRFTGSFLECESDQVQTPLLRQFDAGRRLIRTRVQELSALCRQQGEGIAVYGAGHRTATWLELEGLGEFVDCVIDDDPTKQGRFMTGTAVPVGPASWLMERPIRLCIGLLSADILRKIAARETEYRKQRRLFHSLDQLLPE